MPFARLLMAALIGAGPAAADGFVAARTIPARTILTAADLAPAQAAGTSVTGAELGAGAGPSGLIGLEARVTIFAGRPIRPGDLVSPALVERNAPVRLLYRTAGLTIEAEGRAMARAVAGDTIRVLNTGSRVVVTGRVAVDGSVDVGIPIKDASE